MAQNTTYYIDVVSTAVTINNSGLYAFFPVFAYHIVVDDNFCYFNRNGSKYNDFFTWEETSNKGNIWYDGLHIVISPNNNNETWNLKFTNNDASVIVNVSYNKDYIPHYYGVKSNLEGGAVYFNSQSVNTTIKNGKSIFSVNNNGERGLITINGTTKDINDLYLSASELTFSNLSNDSKPLLISTYAENYNTASGVESYDGVTSPNVPKYTLINATIDRNCEVEIQGCPSWLKYEINGNNYIFTTISDNEGERREANITITLNGKASQTLKVIQYGVEKVIDNLNLYFDTNDYYIDCGINSVNIDDLSLYATITYADIVNGVKTNYTTETEQVTTDNVNMYIDSAEIIRKNGEENYLTYNGGTISVATCEEKENPIYSLIITPTSGNSKPIINIEQESALFDVYINDKLIESDSVPYVFENKGGSVFIKVDSLNDISFSMEENDYYTFNSSDKTIAIYCGANEDDENHEIDLSIENECTHSIKTIKLSQKAFNDVYCILLHTSKDILNNCQEESYLVTIDAREQDIEIVATLYRNGKKLTDLYFDVEGRNPKYVVNPDTIILEGEVDTEVNNDKYILHFDVNDSGNDKEFNILLQNEEGELLSNAVTITQSYFDYIFKVNDSDNITIDVDYRFISEQVVSIMSMLGDENIPYEITSEPSEWVNTYYIDDTNNLIFTYEKNEDNEPRETSLVLTQIGSDKTITINIVQKENTYKEEPKPIGTLIVSPMAYEFDYTGGTQIFSVTSLTADGYFDNWKVEKPISDNHYVIAKKSDTNFILSCPSNDSLTSLHEITLKVSNSTLKRFVNIRQHINRQPVTHNYSLHVFSNIGGKVTAITSDDITIVQDLELLNNEYQTVFEFEEPTLITELYRESLNDKTIENNYVYLDCDDEEIVFESDDDNQRGYRIFCVSSKTEYVYTNAEPLYNITVDSDKGEAHLNVGIDETTNSGYTQDINNFKLNKIGNQNINGLIYGNRLTIVPPEATEQDQKCTFIITHDGYSSFMIDVVKKGVKKDDLVIDIQGEEILNLTGGTYSYSISTNDTSWDYTVDSDNEHYRVEIDGDTLKLKVLKNESENLTYPYKIKVWCANDSLVSKEITVTQEVDVGTFNIEPADVKKYLDGGKYEEGDGYFDGENGLSYNPSGNPRSIVNKLKIHGGDSQRPVKVQFKVNNKNYVFENLYPKTNYIVKHETTNGIKERFLFNTIGDIKVIDFNCYIGIGNFRDFGGFSTNINGKIKYFDYGKLIRGQRVEDLKYGDKDKYRQYSDHDFNVLKNRLNINSEYDLRGTAETLRRIHALSASTPEVLDIKTAPTKAWYNNNVTIHYPINGTSLQSPSGFVKYVSGNTTQQKIYKEYLESIATDLDNNKVVFFHCQGGKDRTGILSLLIRAICNATEDTLIKDWELLFYENLDNVNSTITASTNNYWGSVNMTIFFQQMETWLDSQKKNLNITLKTSSEKIIYMLKTWGIIDDNLINKFRSTLLIDKEPKYNGIIIMKDGKINEITETLV